jgi:hypothetical protein
MIKAPSKEDIKRNEERWTKIHEILRDDAKNQLKNNKVLIPSNRKLLELLIAQREFVGNISSWMPSRTAEDELARLGLIEDAFVIGGFREWFAEQIKQLILDDEISNVIKLFKHIDPSILGDLAGLSDKKKAFIQMGAIWIVKFRNKTITLKDNNRLYLLVALLDKPRKHIHCSDLKQLVRNRTYNPARKVKNTIRAEETLRSLTEKNNEELKDLQLMQIIESATRNVDDVYFPPSGDVHWSRHTGSDDEKKWGEQIRRNIGNALNDIKKPNRALYSHLKICVSPGIESVYDPELDPLVKKFKPWHIRF